ncbi:MAG: transcriptional repressor [Anaerolineae bacterium]|nr:transcriptional repressor [Anaerolineae bacterium]
MSSINDFIPILKHHGVRITPQRIAICKLLFETNFHPTAAMIYDQVKAQYPSLSLMTVYNTLNTLVNLGLVNELGSAGDDNIHYDGNITPHVNQACVSCHKIVDISSPRISNLGNEISISSGYQLLGTRMMYYGLCPNCLKLSNSRKKE